MRCNTYMTDDRNQNPGESISKKNTNFVTIIQSGPKKQDFL